MVRFHAPPLVFQGFFPIHHYNPAVDADPPKRTNDDRRRDAPVFTLEQAATFVQATSGQRLGPMFLLQLVTGMRPGECRGLQWQDVDLNRGTVTVRQAMRHYGVKDGDTWSFGPTKTKRVNTIPTPEDVVQALRQHRARQEAENQDAGSEYRDYGLVFCTLLGTPLNHDNVAKRDFKRVLKVAGLLSSSTLYSMRHSCATLLLSEGVHPKVVSERLGHANITTTLQTYAHVLPTMQEKAIEVLDRMMMQPRSDDDRVGGDESPSLPAAPSGEVQRRTGPSMGQRRPATRGSGTS